MSTATQYTCPQCQRVLRTSTVLGPGQQLRCPACQAVFDPTVPERGAAPPPRYPAAPPAPPPPVYDDYPPRRRPVEDDYDYRRPAMRREPERGWDNRRQWDDGWQPRRRKSPVAAILITLFLLLLGGVFVVTAFIWPGFLRPGSRPSETMESLLAHMPVKPALIVALDFSNLEQRNDLEKAVVDLAPKFMPQLHAALSELKDIDAVVVACKDQKTPSVVAIHTRQAFDPASVRKAFGADEGREVNGKKIYHMPPQNTLGVLAFPDSSNRILLLSSLTETELAGLAAPNRQRLGKPTRQLVDRAGSAPIWIVAHIDAQMREGGFNRLPGIPLAGPDIAAMKRAEAVVLWIESSDHVALNFGVSCASAGDAAEVRRTINDSWNREGKPAIKKQREAFKDLGGQEGMDNILSSVLSDFERSFEVRSDGKLVYARVALSSQTTQQAARMVKDGGHALPLFGQGLHLKGKWEKGGGQEDFAKAPFKGGQSVLNVKGELRNEDPFDVVREKCHHRVHVCRMTAGRLYQIDLTSNWDNYLRLEDAVGGHMLKDDDSGGNLNARIIFRPEKTENYRIIVTSCNAGRTGPYTLSVREE